MRYRDHLKEGDVIGSWTILSIPNKGGKWLLRCECGYKAHVEIYNVVKGTSKSCYPCSVKNKYGSDNPFWKGTDGVPGKKWSRLVKGAKQRNIPVEVDFSYVASLFTDRCSLSGLPIDKNTGSIDRIDSSLGYVIGNIQWVHKDVNKMKNNLPEDRFVELCKLIGELHV